MQITSREEGKPHQYHGHEAYGIDDECGSLESIGLYRRSISEAYQLHFFTVIICSRNMCYLKIRHM